MEITTKSAEETQAAGRKFSASLKAGSVVALSGDLGAGKTTFVQGIAEGLGIKDRIISPTFIIMREYGNFYHVDLYRLEENLENEVTNLGITDTIGERKSIVIIEWAERIKNILPNYTKWVYLESTDENERRIRFEDE